MRKEAYRMKTTILAAVAALTLLSSVSFAGRFPEPTDPPISPPYPGLKLTSIIPSVAEINGK
jgi:hypothetical protein